MSRVRVFVSFDIEHDAELFARLRTQSRGAGFAVLAGSEPESAANVWNERVRLRIREADQVIVICSQHTEASANVSIELRIAQEERRPYFLLWGRREIMCTKPIGARSAEGMYSWTQQILQDQIAFISRNTRADAMAEALRSATRRG